MGKILVALLLLACLVAISSAYRSSHHQCSYRPCNPWAHYPYPQCGYFEQCTQYGYCCSYYGGYNRGGGY